MRAAALSGIGQALPSTRGNGFELRPAGVLRVALLLLVIANLGRIPLLDLGDREAPLLINDLMVMSVIAVSSLVMLRNRSLLLTDVTLAGLLFIAIGTLSAVAAVPRFGLNAFELMASLAYMARWVVYFALYVAIVNCVRGGDVGRIWRALEASMLLFAAFGVVQSIFIKDFAQVVYPDSRPYIDYDPQGHRLMSTVLEPNIAAAMILIVLLVQLAQLSSGERVSAWKPGLLLVALLLTLSRSGTLAFVLGGLTILATRGLSKRLARFIGLAFVGVVAASPKLIEFAASYQRLGITDGSAVARLASWQRAIAVFVDHPWFGIGFNTYGFVQEHRGFERLGGAAYSVEGGLLFIAVMTGLVGLAIYVAMLVFVFRKCRRVWRNGKATGAERALAIGTAAATIAVVVHSVFVNSLLTPFVMEPLWVLWGLTAVIYRDLLARPAPATVRT